MINGKHAIWTQLLHAAVAVVVIVCATVLAALHDIESATAVAVFGAALGFAAGGAIAQSTLGSLTTGRVLVPEGTEREREETLRLAVNKATEPPPPRVVRSTDMPRQDSA